jgi:hypothetical protein
MRLARALTNVDKTTDKITPDPKWGDFGKWYIDWSEAQQVAAANVREAMASGSDQDIEKAKKALKVKATGKKTVDLLVELLQASGSKTTAEVDTLHTALIAKMPLDVSVFPILDTSGSMNQFIRFENTRTNVSLLDLAMTLTITFSAYNPIPEWKGVYGEFAGAFQILGKSIYVDERSNIHMKPKLRQVAPTQVIDPNAPFSKNLDSLRKKRTGKIGGTNMMSAIQYFVKLVESGSLHAEQLPNALMWITDNENNSGLSPLKAQELANSVGWNPLFIFWGISNLPYGMQHLIKDMKNMLLIGGFSEGVLTQVLSFIKKGAIVPEDEIWAIYDNPRYSVLTWA